MAQITRRGKRWRARVRLSGIDVSKSFRTKTEAQAWAAQQEADIINGKMGKIPDRSFGELLERYRDEVSVKKDGSRWEQVRINRLLGHGNCDPDPLVFVRLPDLGPEDFAAWRDRRLRDVSEASVNREWNLLSSACSRAVREWRWLRENPMRHVQRPKNPPPRTRRITEDEIERILYAAGYSPDEPPQTIQARVAAAFLWAIETAMRAGEICALRWSDVDVGRRVAHVRAIEKGARKTRAARTVPLSSRALAILEQMRMLDSDLVFGLKADNLSALFRKIRDKALVEDLHFHDTRREALTRLAAKVDVLTLAKISGHRDLKILSQVYYAPDMAEVAERLD